MISSTNKCLFLLITLTHCLVNSAFPPDIIPDVEEIYINEGERLEIRCISLKKLQMYHPSSEQIQYVTSPINNTEDDAQGIHTAVLVRPVTVRGDTGWYGCADFDVSVTPNIYNEPDVRWLYVYVKSNTSWFVNTEDFDSVHEETGNSVTFGCRPTSPIYSVRFYHEDDEDITDSPVVSYNPKFGFTMANITLKDAGYYKCSIQIDDKEQSTSYYLNVIRKQHILNSPVILENTLRHVVRGQEIRVNCTIDIDRDIQFAMFWNTTQQYPCGPDRGMPNSRISTKYYRDIKGMNSMTAICELIIRDLAYEDEQDYRCTVATHSAKKSALTTMVVHDPSITYINLTSQNPEKHYQKRYGEKITWVVNVDAYPPPKLKWIDPKDHEIIAPWNDPKRGVSTTPTTTMLKINSLTMEDRGLYTLVAHTTEKFETLNFTLDVLSKPVLIEFRNVETYYMPNSTVEIECIGAAFPPANVTWSFMPHLNDLPSKDTGFKVIKTVPPTSDIANPAIVMQIETTGTLKVEACNILGCDTLEQTIFVSDVPKGFSILGPEREVAVNDQLELICGVSIYNYTDEIEWTDDENVAITENERIKMIKSSTPFTYRSTLIISKLKKSDALLYRCKAINTDKSVEDYVYRVIVHDEQFPTFIFTENMDKTEIIYDPETASDSSIVLKCHIDGMPKPNISWWKDDMQIQSTEELYTFVNEDQDLHIEHPREKNSGKYVCKAENRLGFVDTYENIIIKGREISKPLIISIVILVIVCVILVIYFSFKMHSEKVMRKQLMEAGLTHFEEGAIECLNSELTIDDQAELLPYDKKWEFPRERLKFGKQLGSGAFGVVLKAEAHGICESEPTTIVAVKMVRRSTDATYIRALASELKIMVHLGKHLNVVNLLGACTKNIAKRELLVIVEYCRFGNLHNYLLRHRSEFIDQIDSATGKIDPTIGLELLKRSISMGSNNRIKYAALSFSRSISVNSSNGPDTVTYTPGCDSHGVNMSPEGPILSNNSVQPGWRSNYRGDYKDYNLKPICTQDLLSWAFQVARGMDYLSQRRVLHGDLAARNILLAENNVVKICDFGLARTMYKDNNYKKKGNTPVPIKWMAIESLRDHIFSTQSDIWSFGIVLWEFFTLAETPYPGLEAEKQYQKLSEGYRMEKPEYATEEAYDIMQQCWRAKPSLRPSFSELVESIGSLLDESVRMHYVDLNAPYMDMNTAFFESRKNDYLTMMSAPDHETLSSPTSEYVNSPNIPISPASDTSYLPMSPSIQQQRGESGIFSPISTSDTIHFNFPPPEHKAVNSDSDSEAVELSPMLKSEDDNYLTPINVHERRAQFARQRATIEQEKDDKWMERDSGYCNAPQNLRFIEIHSEDILEEVDGNKMNNDDKKMNKNNSNGYKAGIIRTQDNYVNMPRNKNELNRETAPDCFTNPSYIFVNQKIDHTPV